MKDKISKILKLSREFKALRNPDTNQERQNVINYLNLLAVEELLEFKRKLEVTNPEKINKIRLHVINHLLENRNISIEDVEKIKNDVASENETKILLAWKSYFSLFLPFIYKDKVDEALDEIAKKIIGDLGLKDICKIKIVDFDGANNFGEDQAWIAIYNKNQPKQSSSLQMFVAFDGDDIKYGLYRYSNKNTESHIVVDVNEFDYDKLILTLGQVKQEIIDDISVVRYWKFAPGEMAIYWDDMYERGIAGIGWGNHSFVTKTRREISLILPEQEQRSIGIINLFNKAKSGDRIFCFKGRSEIIGFGEITAAAAYSPNEIVPNSNYHNFLKINWVKLDPPTSVSKMVSSDCFADITERSSEFDYLISSYGVTEKVYQKDVQMNLNQILYGPPGTGKTYATISEALRILDPDFLKKTEQSSLGSIEKRAQLKARFDEFVTSERIRFITFHQSFSYEDFVEGLRAETDDTGQLKYQVADGIFKLICNNSNAKLIPGRKFGKGFEVLRVTDDIVELKMPQGGKVPLAMSLVNDLVALVKNEKISIEDIRQKKVFEKLPESGLEKHLINGYAPAFALLVEMLTNDNPDMPPVPKVLIIDEINRGNISRIFGELITLIEPSKRAGATEALSVTLPYSKSKFTVPSNIYLIGTMNTADRSLSTLDIALRRRFSFKEMPARPELLEGVVIEGVNIAEMLKVVNARIEVLLDRDHSIGHAYFMSLKATDKLDVLATIFEQNILPLLQEYFFEDWERISWVLNDQHKSDESTKFIVRSDSSAYKLFGATADSHNLKVDRWRVNSNAFRNVRSYLDILESPV